MSCVSEALGLPKCDSCEFNYMCTIKNITDEDTSDECYGCDGKDKPLIADYTKPDYPCHLRWMTK